MLVGGERASEHDSFNGSCNARIVTPPPGGDVTGSGNAAAGAAVAAAAAGAAGKSTPAFPPSFPGMLVFFFYCVLQQLASKNPNLAREWLKFRDTAVESVAVRERPAVMLAVIATVDEFSPPT